MKCRLVRNMTYGPASGRCGEIAPAGTVLDVPDAWKLVQLGCADPEDAECDEKAGMTAEQRKRAQHAQERAERGIIPEDFAAYDAGVMQGYQPDGSWIPGPNFDEWQWQQRKAESPIIIVED
jgi:hypothetical protein